MSKHAPVNPKVKAASAGGGAGAILGGFLVWCADALFFAGAQAPPVPDPVVGLIYVASAAALAFAAGWLKSELPRD